MSARRKPAEAEGCQWETAWWPPTEVRVRARPRPSAGERIESASIRPTCGCSRAPRLIVVALFPPRPAFAVRLRPSLVEHSDSERLFDRFPRVLDISKAVFPRFHRVRDNPKHVSPG